MKARAEAEIWCFHCEKSYPADFLISGEVIRSGVADIIRKRDPAWTPSNLICLSCLNLFRSEYIEDALEEEKGELSQLDLEVIKSLKEQETVAENLNLAFDKDLTFGQRMADRVASFGGSWGFVFLFFLALFVWMGVNTALVLARPFARTRLSCSI